MKVGIIAPIKFLDRYCITNIQYCLPRLLFENEKYRRFYTERKKRGNTIILDCRKLIWKREPEDFDVIKRAFEILNPTYVIPPSYMYNREETLEELGRFLRRFEDIENYTVCLEGTTKKDVLACYRTLKDQSGTIAIPSHIFNFWKGEGTKHYIIYIENHLNIEELENHDGILVTSLPIRLGLQGRLLSDYLPSTPSLTFYEDEDKYPTVTMRNVQETVKYYREMINA